MRWALIVVALVVTGCGGPVIQAPETTPRYVYYPNREPNLAGVLDAGLLLDTFTGQMWALRGTYFEPIKQIHTP